MFPLNPYKTTFISIWSACSLKWGTSKKNHSHTWPKLCMLSVNLNSRSTIKNLTFSLRISFAGTFLIQNLPLITTFCSRSVKNTFKQAWTKSESAGEWLFQRRVKDKKQLHFWNSLQRHNKSAKFRPICLKYYVAYEESSFCQAAC